MIKKLLFLLVLLMTVATNTWAVDNRLYLDVSGTSATLKYGSDFSGKPSYSSGTWYDIGDVKTTVQTITTDATSCANFSGTTLQYLFEQFTALTSVDLSGLNTANVTAINSMFNGCSSLTSANLSGLNTAKVTNMRALFGGCTSLTSVDLSGLNTSKVTDMANMFNSCSSLTSVDLSSWDTSSATRMGGMFTSCSALTSVNLSSFNTSNVTIMGGMFTSCSSLTTLDLSSFNTSKVTSMTSMFNGCTNLATIYVGNDWSTDAVTSSDDSKNMFRLCTNLPNFNSSKLDHTNAHTGEGGYLSTKPTTYKVTLQEGTEDYDKWTISPTEATKGATVTATYSGTKKVKSVTAVKKNTAYAANEYNEASWDGTKVVFTKQTAASDPTAVANSAAAVTWSAGWYTVSDNVTITGDVSLTADAHLILQDGATLTINGKLYPGNYNLYIYGQSEGTGKLNITNSGDAIFCYNSFEIHGGEITAVSTNQRAIVTGILNVYSGKLTATSDGGNGIQFSSSFDVYGGEVEGTSNATSSSRGITDGGYGKTLTVYGGKVTATGDGKSNFSAYGSGFGCYVMSGTSGIKFYFSADGTTWGDGTSYASATKVGTDDATKKRYAKAE